MTFIHRLLVCATLFAGAALHAADKPVRALIVTGGCCHNYAFQSQAITQAVNKLASVDWTILQHPSTGTRAELNLYQNPDWASKYDIVIHNECFADTTDPDYIRKITAGHKTGVPAVVIHCAMHTYRAAKIDDWREFLGVTSRHHDHMSRYKVNPVDSSHPIMKDFPSVWTTPSDELYIVEKLWPTAKPLATSTSEKDGKAHPVVWINDFHGVRVFGTTFGHSDDTFRDPVFQNLLARGFLWAASRPEKK